MILPRDWTLARAWRRIHAHKHDLLRVVLQTSLAVAVTYGLMTWFGLAHLRWAVIAALLTVGSSADASANNAIGRIGGALLGIALGMSAAWLIGTPAVLVLIVATTLANAVAAVKPNLRYAAVMAAIVSLDGAADPVASAERALAVLVGAGVAVLAGLVAWPVFARRRVAGALIRALESCKDLLELIVRGVGTDDRHERESVHARFFRNLETARSQTAASLFEKELVRGVGLREATIRVESLWHALVILDRVITDERHHIEPGVLEEIERSVREVQRSACREIAHLVDVTIKGGRRHRLSSDFCNAVTAAAERIDGFVDADAGREEARALHALTFALDEIHLRMSQLSDLPHEADGAAADHEAGPKRSGTAPDAEALPGARVHSSLSSGRGRKGTHVEGQSAGLRAGSPAQQ